MSLGYAYTERRCRYRLWDERSAKRCLWERGVRLLMMHENDLFGELLDRWRLGRVEKWCRRE